MPNNSKLELRKFCLSLEIDLFGIADIKNIKHEFLIAPRVLARMDRAVCLGLRISQAALAEIEQVPTRMLFSSLPDGEYCF